MIGKYRPRWLVKSAVTASLALALAACGPEYPNTTFAPLSEIGTEIDKIWDVLLLWGMIVFVLVECALIYIVIRYRHRDSAPEPKHIHGNTTVEIIWTLIPAMILAIIAIPTVKAIFITQGPAPAGALQIEVYGHRWWWEFRYPEYNFKTANEVYLPAGRPVEFHIQSENVIHSFWVPRLSGKRDAVNKRVNRIWFTPDDSLSNAVFNGICTEFCGHSHANMQFRVFVLNTANFASWAAHQASPAAFGATPPAAAATTTTAAGGAAAATAPQSGTPTVAAPAAAIYEFPRSELPDYVIPQKPYPDWITFDENLVGDPARGMAAFSAGATPCIGCHTIVGNPIATALTGPILTHFGSRTTIAGAMYPNTREYLLRWIKNAPGMKPGSLMPPLGKGLVNPLTGITGTLEDQQIADIVAYLMALK